MSGGAGCLFQEPGRFGGARHIPDLAGEPSGGVREGRVIEQAAEGAGDVVGTEGGWVDEPTAGVGRRGVGAIQTGAGLRAAAGVDGVIGGQWQAHRGQTMGECTDQGVESGVAYDRGAPGQDMRLGHVALNANVRRPARPVGRPPGRRRPRSAAATGG